MFHFRSSIKNAKHSSINISQIIWFHTKAKKNFYFRNIKFYLILLGVSMLHIWTSNFFRSELRDDWAQDIHHRIYHCIFKAAIARFHRQYKDRRIDPYAPPLLALRLWIAMTIYSRDAHRTIKIFNEALPLVDQLRMRPFDDLLEPPSHAVISKMYAGEKKR